MEDSEDFAAQQTALYKYIMETKPQTESILEKAKKAVERRYYAKDHAFSCYLCWKHGAHFLDVYEKTCGGPEQFVITCCKCHKHPRKKHASLAQIENFARAYPEISISSYESRRRCLVWPEPPKPCVQSEASREAWEKLFGKD